MKELIEMAEQDKNGILLDEAYEMYHSPAVSGLQYVKVGRGLHHSPAVSGLQYVKVGRGLRNHSPAVLSGLLLLYVKSVNPIVQFFLLV